MCTLALFNRVFDNFPVVVAANRDEFYARPTAPPALLSDSPRVVGGRDLRAGGTWLGISASGLVAGVLNRRSAMAPNPRARSRGLLCLDVLGCESAARGAELAASVRAAHYNPFNLLVVDRADAYVVHWHPERPQLIRLSPGLHMVTNLDVDDPECPRIGRVFARFAALAHEMRRVAEVEELKAALAPLLADHDSRLDERDPGPNPLCLHSENYGTRSASIIALAADETLPIAHFYADGPPCTAPFRPAPVP